MSKTESTTANLIDQLEDAIVNGQFSPGEKLEEERLSKLYNVSRTPVRESLRQLTATGLIEIIPNRGAYVVELGIPKIIEMFEVMAELEAMCGRLAARRITDSQQQQLLSCHEKTSLAANQGNFDKYYYENEQFHFAIYTASNNQFLCEQAMLLHKRLKPYRRLQLRVPKRMKSSCLEHGRIVDAIITANEQQAESELKNHILIQGEKFSDLISLVNYQINSNTKAQ